VVLVAGCAGAGPAGQGRALDLSGPRPSVGTCYDAPFLPHSLWADGTEPVACEQSHRLETFHVGTLDVPVGAPPVVPASQPLFDASASCATAARDFLGAEWYTGRVEIGLTLPGPDDWQAGNRAYSCELMQVDEAAAAIPARRTGSLRGALTAAGPLTLGCLTATDVESLDVLRPVACDQPHDAEFAGAFTADRPMPPNHDDLIDAGFDGCYPVALAYVGTSRFHPLRWWFSNFSEADWGFGNRTARCYVIAPKGTRLKASVKGIGTAAPPVA
jgi:hypothetical protein